jgi:hypothetical protein
VKRLLQAGGRAVLCGLTAALICGCFSGHPDQANIALRKDNQQLSAQIADLHRQNDALAAQLNAIEQRPGATLPQLPQSRLDKLFTVSGLNVSDWTGGYTPLGYGPDQMLRVYAVPIDQTGDVIKAAGSFTVELFDLDAKRVRLGTWTFPVEQASANWYDQVFLETYILNCPWQIQPTHADLLVRVKFTDELTGRQFAVDRDVKIHLPPPAP